MALYPIMLNMSGKLAVIVGGGEVALRKLKDLVEAGARVRIVSPEVHDRIAGMAASNPDMVEIVRRGYLPGDLETAALAFSAAGSTAVNKCVFAEAEERGIFINAVDDPPNCSFFLPSFARKGDLILAVSTGGASPAIAARLRRKLEECLPGDIETTLDALREARALLQTRAEFAHLCFSARGAIMKKIVDDNILLERLVEAYKKKGLLEFFKLELITFNEDPMQPLSEDEWPERYR